MQRRKPHVRPVAKNCIFCAQKTSPTYRDIQTLEKYVTERGKILGRAKTGICATHQRKLTESVKRARHVALLPFIVRA